MMMTHSKKIGKKLQVTLIEALEVRIVSTVHASEHCVYEDHQCHAHNGNANVDTRCEGDNDGGRR